MIESKKAFINETEICEFADDIAVYSCSLNYKEANQKSSNDNKIILNSAPFPPPPSSVVSSNMFFLKRW